MDEAEEAKILRQAMAIARSRRDPVKLAESARAVAESRIGTKWTEEQKANLREKQKERRERERAERGALAPTADAEPKRPRGRPRKQKESIDGQS